MDIIANNTSSRQNSRVDPRIRRHELEQRAQRTQKKRDKFLTTANSHFLFCLTFLLVISVLFLYNLFPVHITYLAICQATSSGLTTYIFCLIIGGCCSFAVFLISVWSSLQSYWVKVLIGNRFYSLSVFKGKRAKYLQDLENVVKSIHSHLHKLQILKFWLVIFTSLVLASHAISWYIIKKKLVGLE